MAESKPKIKVIVTPPGAKAVLVLEENTGKLLLYTVSYNSKIRPGVYTEPEDIVNIFKMIATRGHETKTNISNPMIVYLFLINILQTEAPFDEKIEHLKRYVRAAFK